MIEEILEKRYTMGRMPNETNQADRHNQGKPKISMVLEMPHAVEGVARVFEYGATKYARRNFQKGLPFTEVADSLLRHFLDWLNGSDIDVESGCKQVDMIAWNAMALAEFARTRPEFDDRGVSINRENSFEEWIAVKVLENLREGDTLCLNYGPDHNTVNLRIVGVGGTVDGFTKVRLSPMALSPPYDQPTAFPAGQSDESASL